MTRNKSEMPRREEFLTAALNRFAKFGYMGTSTRDICAEVGLVHSAIYNYFPSKEAVVLAIEEREMKAMLDGLGAVIEAPGQDARERLTATVRYVFDRSIVRRNAWRLMADMIRSLKPRARNAVIERRDRFETMVRNVLVEAVEAGILPPQDTRLASLTLFGMAEGMSGWFRKNGPNSMEEVVDHATSFFLNGVGAKAAEMTKPVEKPVRKKRSKADAAA
ncbi:MULTISPECIES: TetR/AcrR family transcriptional regulator [unclassified Chelatococcus]|uniref:TetR/AcrR family transcriptional regulator n=1 Tax=unclassified Chelatococcus TaxID=2638111 RepID=UPI001BCD417F|nr:MULTISPECIES: TetR/AcrR family transcriptional regulator [unclassified Chelatococcus]MBS7697643.1 TetR family transcriptional regulator [Chelatococcus sp. YT9]MBX3559017.1 TetR family transcriptional regulator [Chelatococcus sp.]